MKELDGAILDSNRKMRQSEFELTGLIHALLNAVRSVGFDTVIFGLVNEDRSAIRGPSAEGKTSKKICGGSSFP